MVKRDRAAASAGSAEAQLGGRPLSKSVSVRTDRVRSPRSPATSGARRRGTKAQG